MYNLPSDRSALVKGRTSGIVPRAASIHLCTAEAVISSSVPSDSSSSDTCMTLDILILSGSVGIAAPIRVIYEGWADPSPSLYVIV